MIGLKLAGLLPALLATLPATAQGAAAPKASRPAESRPAEAPRAASQADPEAMRRAAEPFTALRLKYAGEPEAILDWNGNKEREALLKRYDEEAPGPFIDAARAWLRRCPVDAKVHMALANLLLRRGDVPEGVHHRYQYYGLMSSILASGDGRTPETAWKVISVDEEYLVLGYLGARPGRQSLKGSVDVMEVTVDGKPATFCFDATLPLERLKKQFGGSEEKEAKSRPAPDARPSVK